jgi:DNA-binding response OmpR family regulator
MANAHGIGTTVVPLEEAFQAGDVEKCSGGSVVLIVDGDRLAADTWSAIFRLHGYCVLTAYDGVSGYAMAKATPPDLVITSVTMAGMGGLELGILLQKAIPGCKVLLFSGQSPQEMLAAAGASEYGFQMVVKPVHPTQMLQRAAAWLQAA